MEFKQLQAFKEECLKRELHKGLKSLEEGNVLESGAVISALRKRVEDA